MTNSAITEVDRDNESPDPDSIPIRDRKVVTQPYDLTVQSLVGQIKKETIFLRPLSERPDFQRRYVWSNKLASRLIESILLNVPIPPCFFSQNDEFELDVIDGQQRLFSIYRFLENQFKLSDLEVLNELNGHHFFELPQRSQRQIETHTLRCVLITNESHPEIKFDVFERLNTNTVPLNAQELRNCIYRGRLNSLLKEAANYGPWLEILGKKHPDRRMRDEELVLRFFAFYIHGVNSYRTPQKHWLNSAAKDGRNYNEARIRELSDVWKKAIDNSLLVFKPNECFRRQNSKAINRALFDIVAVSMARMETLQVGILASNIKLTLAKLLSDDEFQDLISRAIDHTKRTKRRFELWEDAIRSAHTNASLF